MKTEMVGSCWISRGIRVPKELEAGLILFWAHIACLNSDLRLNDDKKLN